ncbi:MAG: hypothetical protein KF789_04055, partial [Bdellovibrionaceae bacterium]|nr:hypothetical protein [Pseudobdellovibrionaceae bacterium]
VRWINWALAKIREAKKQGLSLTLDELMAQRNVPATPAKRSRRKLAPESAHDETLTTPSKTLNNALEDESQS